MPAGAQITVVGIPDHSFAQPYILLSATVPDDAGYFGERLRGARQTLVETWKQRSSKLEPEFPGTDILGTLELAGQVLDQRDAGSRKVLVLFSDMRNHTREFDLETEAGIASALTSFNDGGFPNIDLRGVDVYALGVDGAGERPEDWQRVEALWRLYLRRCHAALVEYLVLRATSHRF